jgi:hypothetical protein
MSHEYILNAASSKKHRAGSEIRTLARQSVLTCLRAVRTLLRTDTPRLLETEVLIACIV